MILKLTASYRRVNGNRDRPGEHYSIKTEKIIAPCWQHNCYCFTRLKPLMLKTSCNFLCPLPKLLIGQALKIVIFTHNIDMQPARIVFHVPFQHIDQS